YHQDKTRSLAIGIHMTGLYMGQALGGFGAVVASAFTWHTAFHVFGLTGIIYSLILILFLREKRMKDISETAQAAKPSVLKGLRVLFSNPAFWIILIYFTVPSLPGWAVKNWLPTLFAQNLNIPMASAGPLSTI